MPKPRHQHGANHIVVKIELKRRVDAPNAIEMTGSPECNFVVFGRTLGNAKNAQSSEQNGRDLDVQQTRPLEHPIHWNEQKHHRRKVGSKKGFLL